jgi:hypothetical protein
LRRLGVMPGMGRGAHRFAHFEDPPANGAIIWK